MKAIYLAGTDGSGKTSYIKEIEAYLLNEGLSVKHIWLRSPKIFSKPLMAYCRLVGLTKYKTIDGVKYGKHEFYKSKFVSYLFPILQLIDLKIKWIIQRKKIKKNELMLFDRFSLDTLADLMVDTNRLDLHKTYIGKAFLRTIPKNSQIIVLDVEEAVIRSRKKDTLYDEHLSSKIAVYKLLAQTLELPIIDNNKTFKEVKDKIFRTLKLC